MGCLELYPNCSEIVWRLDFPEKRSIKEKICDTLMEVDVGEEFETDTASFPNGGVEAMIDMIKNVEKQGVSLTEIDLNLVDNIGGGGNGYYVEGCFDIAMAYCNGEITKNQALKREQRLWETGGEE